MAMAVQARLTGFQLLREQPRSAAAEAYRSLRTSLQFLPKEKQAAIVVTSCAAGEGKTTTTVNLGLALASAGKRVLLVDADLRRPMLHTVFGLGRTLGLSHVLSDQTKDPVVQETDVPGLEVLPSGPIPPNPSELLGLPPFAAALERWRGQYDHVLFDAPPVLGLTDAVVLARRVGYALLVVRAGETSDRALRRAAEQLRAAGVDVLGAILNAQRSDADVYGYGYTYGYGQRPEPRAPGADPS